MCEIKKINTINLQSIEYRRKSRIQKNVKKTRSDKGLIRLTDRDLKTLTWVGEQYAVRIDTLQELLGRDTRQPTKADGCVSASTARRVVGRWKQERLADVRKYFYREPEWIWLTRKGLKQMNLDYSTWSPSVSTLNHLHDLNKIRSRIEDQFPECHWRSERSLRRKNRKNTRTHIADGEVHLSGQVIAIELELTQKSKKRVSRIARKLRSQYDRIWYFVNEQTRAVIERATEGQADKFRLYDVEKVYK